MNTKLRKPAKKRKSRLKRITTRMIYEEMIYLKEHIDTINYNCFQLVARIGNTMDVIRDRLLANQIGLDNVYKEFEKIKEK